MGSKEVRKRLALAAGTIFIGPLGQQELALDIEKSQSKAEIYDATQTSINAGLAELGLTIPDLNEPQTPAETLQTVVDSYFSTILQEHGFDIPTGTEVDITFLNPDQRQRLNLPPDIFPENAVAVIGYLGVNQRADSSTSSAIVNFLTGEVTTTLTGEILDETGPNQYPEWVVVAAPHKDDPTKIVYGKIALAAVREAFAQIPSTDGRSMLDEVYYRDLIYEINNTYPTEPITYPVELNTGGAYNLPDSIDQSDPNNPEVRAISAIVEDTKQLLLSQLPQPVATNTSFHTYLSISPDRTQTILHQTPLHQDPETGATSLIVFDQENNYHLALIPEGSNLSAKINTDQSTEYILSLDSNEIARMGAGVSFTPNPNLGESIGLDIISQYLAGLAGPDDLRPRLSSIADRKLQEYATANGYTLEEVKEWQQDALLRLHRDLKPLAESGQLQFDPSLQGYVRGSREAGNLQVWRRNVSADNNVESGWLDIMDEYTLRPSNTRIILEGNRNELSTRQSGYKFSNARLTDYAKEKLGNWILDYAPSLSGQNLSIRLISDYRPNDDHLKSVNYFDRNTPGESVSVGISGNQRSINMWVNDLSRFYPGVDTEFSYEVKLSDTFVYGAYFLEYKLFGQYPLQDMMKLDNFEYLGEGYGDLFPGKETNGLFVEGVTLFDLRQ